MLGETVVVKYETVEGEGTPSGSGSEVQECPLDIAPRDQAEVVPHMTTTPNIKQGNFHISRCIAGCKAYHENTKVE